MVAYFEYGEDSYSFSFCEKINDEYLKCYDITGIYEDSIEKSFDKLDKIISQNRNDLKEKWSNMTMVVDARGNMHTDFDYTDLLEDGYKYKKEWKKKYLD